MRNRFLSALVALLVVSHASAQNTALPTELASIPGDATAVVQVRVADLWKSDSMKEIRDLLMKAGPDVVEAFDKRWMPAPSNIDRVVVFARIPTGAEKNGPAPTPEVVMIIKTTKALQPEAFVKTTFKESKKEVIGKIALYSSPKEDTAVAFLDDQTFAVSDQDMLRSWLKGEPKKGAMTEVLGMDVWQKPLALAVLPTAMPIEQIAREMPPQMLPLLRADLVLFSLDFAAQSSVNLQVRYPNEKTLSAAKDSIKELSEIGKKEIARARKELTPRVKGDGKVSPLDQFPQAASELLILAGLGYAEEILNDLPIQTKGTSLSMTVKVPSWMNAYIGTSALSVGLLLPAVQKVREAAARTQSQNNLKQMGLAMHNFESVNGKLPAAAICDKNGKPLLSWRVAILPYIEQQNLYNRFKLDEPWDSENNIKLLPLMPKIYLHPSAQNVKPGFTNYRAFVGAEAAFDLTKPGRIEGFSDGTSNTIWMAESEETVEWTKPVDFAYDAKKPLPKLGGLSRGGFNVGFADGSIRFIRDTIDEKTLRALITRAGGETVSPD